MATMEEAVRCQAATMARLRGFVDALRDIKSEDDITEHVHQAVKLLSTSETPSVDQWSELLLGLLRDLVSCMQRIEEIENATKPATSGRAARQTAPAGLLSLRDYSVLQAAIEVIICWRAYGLVDEGVLLPIGKRRPTKTLQISTQVLQWAQRQDPADPNPTALNDLVQNLLELLLLPQLQPILMPKYVVELLALLMYGESVCKLPGCAQQRERLMRALPLRLSMSSIRAALGQSARKPSAAAVIAFKQKCGELLSELLMRDGGVQATIEMLLGAVDEGNTQARVQVATLICQCPSGVQPEAYITAVCQQIRDMLLIPPIQQTKLLCETASLVVNQLVSRDPAAFDSQLFTHLFRPLLLYGHITTHDQRDPANRGTIAHEDAVVRSVAILHLFLCGPPPSADLLTRLAPLFRPVAHMYNFARGSKSHLLQPLREVIVEFVRSAPHAEDLLQIAVLPSAPMLNTTLRQDGWSTRRGTPPSLRAGANGGIQLCVDGDFDEEADALRQKEVIMALVEILGSKELETSQVVGHLFASLLTTCMRVRKLLPLESGDDAKQPTDAAGVENILCFLLAIIEALGPSVLRSADVVLSCIDTVLQMYTSTKAKLVDQETDEPSMPDNDDEDEILTVCLGVIMTILEAGASTRSDSEELQLRAMLPVLETLSAQHRPQVAELASEARLRILSRGVAPAKPERKVETDNSFDDVLAAAAQDLSSTLVPLRARGVVILTKMVRRSQSERHHPQWQGRVVKLLDIFVEHLGDSESYVFLAAVQGLSSLADAHPKVAIPKLVAALQNHQLSLEKRIKLSEALLFTAKRCGETLPVYAQLFVFAYLDCIRPPATKTSPAPVRPISLIQDITDAPSTPATPPSPSPSPSPSLADATLRASCLSNLAEVCAMLQWALHPFVNDVMTCVFGILQLEVANSQSDVAVRRGAVFLIKYVLQLMGWKILEVMPGQLKPMYHTLKHVTRVERDSVVVFHATKALEALDTIMRQELFPHLDEDLSSAMSMLRIVN